MLLKLPFKFSLNFPQIVPELPRITPELLRDAAELLPPLSQRKPPQLVTQWHWQCSEQEPYTRSLSRGYTPRTALAWGGGGSEWLGSPVSDASSCRGDF